MLYDENIIALGTKAKIFSAYHKLIQIYINMYPTARPFHLTHKYFRRIRT